MLCISVVSTWAVDISLSPKIMVMRLAMPLTMLHSCHHRAPVFPFEVHISSSLPKKTPACLVPKEIFEKNILRWWTANLIKIVSKKKPEALLFSMDYPDYTKILQDKLREHFNRVVFFPIPTKSFGPESWGISAWLQGSGRGRPVYSNNWKRPC